MASVSADRLLFCVLLCGQTLLLLAMVPSGAVLRCYKKEGPDGLTAESRVLKRDCKPLFSFIVNVLDPIVQTHECTGVLVDPRTVVVPATCVSKKPRSRQSFPLVRIGSFDLNYHDGSEEEEVFSVCQKIIHSGFDGYPLNGSDIALLILSQDAKSHEPISKTAGDVEYFATSNCSSGDLMTIGWFSPRMNGPPSQFVEVEDRLSTVPSEDCAWVFGRVPKKAMCAVAPFSSGIVWDLGSPLLCDGKVLVGIASFTKHKVDDNPYLYTLVADYREWIESRGAGAATVEVNGDEKCRENSGRAEL